MKAIDHLLNRPHLPADTLACIAAIDAVNNTDPRRVTIDGVEMAFEHVHAIHVTNALLRLDPEACDALLIAGRASHVGRWKTPRSNYPAGLAGYFQWKEDLKVVHGNRAAEVMARHGFSKEAVERVKTIVLRQNIPEDSGCCALEDALCLTFLETQLEDFMGKHPREKVIDILQKTWGKMTEKGHALALELPFSDAARAVIEDALK